MGGSDNPSDAKRKEILKGIIRDLHRGEDIKVLKKRFEELVKEVGGDEIPRLEQELINEGLPQEEVASLCDVHVQIFKASLDRQEKPEVPPGHPLHTLKKENQALSRVAEDLKEKLEKLGDPPSAERFLRFSKDIARDLEDLAQVEKHYLKKENQIFPFLEKHGITAPPQVMWVIHDQVRNLLAKAKRAMAASDLSELARAGKEAATIILDMIYKEENILFPLCLNTFSEDEWVEIRKGEPEIGYALILPGDEWEPGRKAAEEARAEAPAPGPGEAVTLDTGALSPEQVNLILKHLTADITFVDENDEVRYFSAGKERIFPRSPGIIGRKVQMCHPPKSVHIVNRILDEFKKGTKDEAEFWIQYKGRFVHILYRAVRDENGKYRGTLEISQDITELRKLEGEKRLLDWEEQE